MPPPEGKGKGGGKDQARVLRETRERLARLEASRRELLAAGAGVAEDPPEVSSFKVGVFFFFFLFFFLPFLLLSVAPDDLSHFIY
jgi:hypothetical protein